MGKNTPRRRAREGTAFFLLAWVGCIIWSGAAPDAPWPALTWVASLVLAQWWTWR